MQDQTFCMVKPDGVSRGLTDEVKNRITGSGLEIKESKAQNVSLEEAKKLYQAHEGKSFYAGLVKFITKGSVCLMKIEGENAVARLRDIMGATDPRQALPGTIRCDFKEENIFNEDKIIKNIVHGSDSIENAKYELSIFFS